MKPSIFCDIIKIATLPCYGVIDKRGRGNKAARRAAMSSGFKDHQRWACEDIYTERPYIFRRASYLLINDIARKNGVVLDKME